MKRPTQLVSVYLNEKEPTPAIPAATPRLIVQEGNTTVSSACATMRFNAPHFDIQGNTSTAVVVDYEPKVQQTDQETLTLANPAVSNLTPVGAGPTSMTAAVVAGFYRDKFGRGIYHFGVQGSIVGTNGPGPQTFTLNIVPFFPEYAAPPTFTVPVSFPGYAGWNLNGGYTNPMMVHSNASSVMRIGTVQFLSATSVRLSFFNTAETQFFHWNFTFIQ